jgi:hypothetical protein
MFIIYFGCGVQNEAVEQGDVPAQRAIIFVRSGAFCMLAMHEIMKLN